jgi:hypothetical protein
MMKLKARVNEWVGQRWFGTTVIRLRHGSGPGSGPD